MTCMRPLIQSAENQNKSPQTETMYCGPTLGRRQRQEDEAFRAILGCLEVHKTPIKEKKKAIAKITKGQSSEWGVGKWQIMGSSKSFSQNQSSEERKAPIHLLL